MTMRKKQYSQLSLHFCGSQEKKLKWICFVVDCVMFCLIYMFLFTSEEKRGVETTNYTFACNQYPTNIISIKKNERGWNLLLFEIINFRSYTNHHKNIWTVLNFLFSLFCFLEWYLVPPANHFTIIVILISFC